jgi:hypothetical protein
MRAVTDALPRKPGTAILALRQLKVAVSLLRNLLMIRLKLGSRPLTQKPPPAALTRVFEMVGHTGFEPTLEAGQTRFLSNQVWPWLLEVEELRRHVGMLGGSGSQWGDLRM